MHQAADVGDPVEGRACNQARGRGEAEGLGVHVGLDRPGEVFHGRFHRRVGRPNPNRNDLTALVAAAGARLPRLRFGVFPAHPISRRRRDPAQRAEVARKGGLWLQRVLLRALRHPRVEGRDLHVRRGRVTPRGRGPACTPRNSRRVEAVAADALGALVPNIRSTQAARISASAAGRRALESNPRPRPAFLRSAARRSRPSP
mmetsp:Transcript_4862/g.13539  ORF Transcript_4862/g.13539 Transcript_4862/m.13539 type:complete len:202 (+) Transcript_4862:704-1309(+)